MKPTTPRRPAFGKKRADANVKVERATIGKGGAKKPFGPRKSFGKKDPFEARGPKSDKPFSRRPREDGESDKPFGGEKKSYGERKSFGDKKPYGERKSYGDKPAFGEKKSYGERKSFGDKKPYGERKSYGDKPAFGEKKSYGERKSFGDKKPYGERKSYGDKPSFGDKESYGERKSFGDRKPYGERKSFGDKPAFGERKSYGERKPYGDKKPYGERKSFGDKPSFGEKKSFGSRSAPALQADPNGVLLWGTHAVREAFLNGKRPCTTLWVTDAGLEAISETLQAADKSGIKRPAPTLVSKEDIEKLLPRGSVHQGLVLDARPLPETTLDDLLGLDDAPECLVLLDQVTDPHNVGAILRSAAALGAGAVLVTERHAPTTTGLMAKTACGACEHVPLVPVVNLARALEDLKRENYWIVGLAEEGERELSACSLATGRIALVLGAEGDGLRRLTREHCDELVRLPTGGSIGSLNVSNATAIALYEVRRQKKG